MSLKKFILSKLFVKNLALAMALAVGIVIILLIWLNIYTRHGQARPVPDFYGLTLKETAALAKKSKLRYQILDSVFISSVPPGCIADQNPKPGFKVKKTRRIILTINAFNPEMVGVPDLKGLSIKQAIAQVGISGFEIGKLFYKPDISIDFVIDQLHNGKEITPGDSLQKGSEIDLVLGKGLSNQRTLVPDLIGLDLESAKNSILAASLNLGTYIYDTSIKSASDTLNAVVFKQNPDYSQDASLQLGSSIYLWLSVDSIKTMKDPALINNSDSTSSSTIIQGATN